jgi:poly-gamma-glutamate capsule biosynthesis protein CapA/YwtB (metallophosphatase superfamily)
MSRAQRIASLNASMFDSFCRIVFVFLLPLMVGAGHSMAEESVRIVFVGDVMLDELPGERIAKGFDPFAEFADIFKSADLSIANLECAVGYKNQPNIKALKEDKPFTFMANPRVLPLLKKHFSAVSLANNHSGDYGPVAFEGMLDHLNKAGVKYFGGGRNLKQAHQPAIFTVKGKRIAILAYNLFLPRSFEALHDRAGSAWGEEDYIADGIRRARQEHKADFVVVYPHWGWENEKFASPAQQRLAKFMLDQGADAVVGGHPHVTQNIQIYDGKPIFYSLGNFVFNGFDTVDTNTGWVLELELNARQAAKWRIFEARIDKWGIPKNRGQISVMDLSPSK